MNNQKPVHHWAAWSTIISLIFGTLLLGTLATLKAYFPDFLTKHPENTVEANPQEAQHGSSTGNDRQHFSATDNSGEHTSGDDHKAEDKTTRQPAIQNKSKGETDTRNLPKTEVHRFEGQINLLYGKFSSNVDTQSRNPIDISVGDSTITINEPLCCYRFDRDIPLFAKGYEAIVIRKGSRLLSIDGSPLANFYLLDSGISVPLDTEGRLKVDAVLCNGATLFFCGAKHRH